MKSSLLVAPLCLYLGCISDPGKPPLTENYLYPLAVGNTWTYERTFRGSNFRDTSGNLLPSQSSDSLMHGDTVQVIVDHVDTIPGDTAPSFVLVTNGQSADWYRNSADGLFAIAYANRIGAPWATPKAASLAVRPMIRLHFKGMEFHSLRALNDFLLRDTRLVPMRKISTSLSDTTFWIPPRPMLLYPYTEGKVWEIFGSIRMGRQYVGIEEIEVPAGRFECYKVKLLWDVERNGSWDTDAFGYEYISRTGEGMVKRDLHFYGIGIYNELGAYMGTYDDTENCNLTSYRVE